MMPLAVNPKNLFLPFDLLVARLLNKEGCHRATSI
jgi:hypothetical protein